MLEIRKLTVGYGRREPILRDVDMVLPVGGVLGLVGMNGAGKTTLMRAVSGGVRPRSGHVLLDGEDVTGLTTARLARRGLVILPEGHRVLRPLTVDENLQIATMGLRRNAVRRRIGAVSELVYDLFPILRDRRDQLAGLLSGGEQQMLSLARAIVQSPRVLLLDEPSLGLAPLIVDRIYQALSSLREHGISMLVVEQNSERVAASCEELIVLRDGRVSAQGPPAELQGKVLQTAYFG
ncbi:MAG: hypothetical protein ABS81_01135 [Pseudonocardia sp. SCN 72-86]|nr:MAG: hypothetical protein ABS81_01135 [Pseudonocardia sp. SCN 72-86]